MRGILESNAAGKLKMQAIAVVARTMANGQDASDPYIEHVTSEKIPAITTAMAAQEIISDSMQTHCGTLAEAIKLVHKKLSPDLLKSLRNLNGVHVAAKHSTRSVDKVLLGRLRAELNSMQTNSSSKADDLGDEVHEDACGIGVEPHDDKVGVEGSAPSVAPPALLPHGSSPSFEELKDCPFTVDLCSFLRAELNDVAPFETVVHVTSKRLEIIIRTRDTAKLRGTKGERINSLQSCLCRRYQTSERVMAVFAETVQ